MFISAGIVFTITYFPSPFSGALYGAKYFESRPIYCSCKEISSFLCVRKLNEPCYGQLHQTALICTMRGHGGGGGTVGFYIRIDWRQSNNWKGFVSFFKPFSPSTFSLQWCPLSVPRGVCRHAGTCAWLLWTGELDLESVEMCMNNHMRSQDFESIKTLSNNFQFLLL